MAPGQSRTGTRRALILLAVALGYSAVAVAGAPWTLYSAVFTGVAGFVLLWSALARGWHRARIGTPATEIGQAGKWGLAVWALLFTALGVWILAVHFSSPREQYPTLSYLMNGWFEDYPVRVGGFLAWLVLGWWLVRR